MDARGPRYERVERATHSAYVSLRQALLAGVAVVVPLVVTLYVLTVLAGLLTQLLDPLGVALVGLGVAADTSHLLVQAVAALLLVLVTLGVGFVAHFRYGKRAIGYFDSAVEALPGVGAIYRSFRRMGKVMVDDSSHNFQEVKLVEFPTDGTYTLGFETSRTPEAVRTAAGHESMTTLFLPLAPNPVMGGFLAHVPDEQISDVEMSVEEGVQAIVTMGMAAGGAGTGSAGLSREELEGLTDREVAEMRTETGER